MPAESQRVPRRDETPPAIPGYEVGSFIGRGSSGAVYRARQLAVDREVAIKILHPHVARESRVVRRLQREARTTARLAHPHIVSAVDMGETPDGRWWYAMEFVDGPSLAQRLRSEGRIREREALRLFIPLCEALEHLWEHGVVHRDVKPGNILIDRAGGARLADLGLAVAEDDPSITGTGGTLGTPHYISPEQAVDPRKADGKSDIWSFGATLFHAVCGRPPFGGESAAEVLSGVLYSPIPDPEELEPSLSSRLALVLRKCLTRDATRRYQNPHELLLDLERVRERRAPKIRRRSLDPVLRRADHGRRIGLAVAAGLVLTIGGGALLLPRLLARDSTVGGMEPAPSGPFEPLAELELRRASGIGKPAEHMGELLEMEALVPVRERVRYEELRRVVGADLRSTVRTFQGEIDAEIDEEIRAGDLEAAWSTLLDDLEPRCALATGYGVAGLDSIGVHLAPWRERIGLTLQAATETAVDELEAMLHDFRSARLSAVEEGLVEHDWERAQAALRLPDERGVLAQAGFKLRLPPASVEGLLGALVLEFRQRSQKIQDEWQALDRELRQFVVTRRATLERQLENGPPRIPAEVMLRRDFEAELFDRRLSRDKMPGGLSRAGLEELESSARGLAELEERLLEEDARADHGEVEELAADALRTRDYDRALALWEELHERLASAPRFAESDVRQELARRADLRILEARELDALLERVVEAVRRLDGQTIELRLGAITYPSVRLRAEPDPRRDGFRIDDRPTPLRLGELPSAQIEAFLGVRPDAELSPEERLTLASFRFHEGHAQEAERTLFSGPLPGSALGSELGTDLASRIAAALERGATRAGERDAEARRMLEDVLDPEFRQHSARVARARITRLLDDFGDVLLVKQQRGELLRLRDGLEESAPRDAEREFERAYAPDRLELSPLSSVMLGWDFTDGTLGAWESGDWAFDGLGIVLGPRGTILGGDQLAVQRGLRLALRTPLVPDEFELRVKFEAVGGDTPARLLWLSAGGFHVALGASDLPGSAGARTLVGTDEPSAFLKRLLSGEGVPGDPAIVPGTPPRVLYVHAQRRSGRCEILLDGEPIPGTAGLRAPPSDARAIVVRSWGSVRVLEVTIEAGR